MEIKRGEIWLADLNPTRGTEQRGIRPVIVLQTDKANSTSPHTIIAPFTTKIRTKLLPCHVEFKAGIGGLSESSVLLTEQLRVVDKERLFQRIGAAPGDRIGEISEAVRVILDL